MTQREGAIGWTLAAAALAAALTAGMTVLNLGGRYVLGQGGFVARGGPYEIAHPAPDWIWIVPVSIVAGAVIILLHIVAAKRANGFDLLGFMWVGLFGSLGWQFFDAWRNPPEGQQDVWVWLMLALMFWIMALPVALGLIGSFLPDLPTDRRRWGWGMPAGLTSLTGVPFRKGSPVYRLSHLAAVPLGIWLGTAIFGAVAG